LRHAGADNGLAHGLTGGVVVTADSDLDAAALGTYLAARLGDFGQAFQIDKFTGGQSNPTYRLTTGKQTYVLRKKPAGILLKSAHAIEREFRVLQALAGTAVPVPRVHLFCADTGVIGTEFFLMDFVDGRIYWHPALPDLERSQRRAIYDATNQALVELHRLDPEPIGLSDFGRPGNYFARQLARWLQQYRAAQTVRFDDIERLIAWLEPRTPEDDGRIALVHGDYRLDNLIFDPKSLQLLAILDWELSTLGHPFADLAYQCMQWRLPQTGPFAGLGDLDRTALGIPSEATYVAQYCLRAGLPGIANWPFYVAFSFFRLAAILQGVKRRALDGNASNPERAHLMGEVVPIIGRLACQMIEAEG
jgi:aminoglycoside phosphotransferase (APT) family kinase protein